MYATIQLSLLVSTMIKSATGVFEENIDCECDVKNICTVHMEEVIHKHQEWLSYFQTK